MSSSSIIKILFALVFPILCSAQSAGLSGKVFDPSNKPLAFADAVVLTVPDSTAYKATFTDEAGRFEFKGLAHGNYVLKISTIGYADYFTSISLTGNTVLPNIVLKETATQLGAVVINSKRPIVNRKIDRLEFDVGNSILSSDNAWEILRKTPGVNVTSGGISIRGSNSILVTINDKKST
ncbi:hypothetical protein HYN59_07790 [Flavobacterium album]|uniref:TonB-dependent receptor n=1 Tax=Flavobacterium album TaxID=2175091 RepID=A0A2S1QXA1_9FLAO|nr:carboxypeptidase-like regulatory domain-containing protein [Flavobacterium album]AWH85032.1 hypothetical protein HYN59_07790 [Flavobacterium album]